MYLTFYYPCVRLWGICSSPNCNFYRKIVVVVPCLPCLAANYPDFSWIECYRVSLCSQHDVVVNAPCKHRFSRPLLFAKVPVYRPIGVAPVLCMLISANTDLPADQPAMLVILMISLNSLSIACLKTGRLRSMKVVVKPCTNWASPIWSKLGLAPFSIQPS